MICSLISKLSIMNEKDLVNHFLVYKRKDKKSIWNKNRRTVIENVYYFYK